MALRRLTKKLTAALVAVFLCLNVSAETSLKLGGFSQHLGDGDYNSFHRVAIASHNNYFAGYFRNSFYDDSFVVGKTYQIKRDSLFSFTVNVGAVYGYRRSSGCYKKQDERDNDPKILCPMIAPEVTAYKLPLKPSLALFGLDAVVLTFNVNL